MIRSLVGAMILVALACSARADMTEIRIGYLRHAAIPSTLSLALQPAENDGTAGARLAIDDNNTTGRFLNQRFALDEVRLKDGDDVAAAALKLADGGAGFIIADLGAHPTSPTPITVPALLSLRSSTARPREFRGR